MIPQSILVTGGAGFIGRWVVKELLAGGRAEHAFTPPAVVVLDNLENGRESNLDELRDDPHFSAFFQSDIKDRALINQLFARYKFDLVLHLAAKINVQESIDDPVGVFESDVIGTFNLLEQTRQTGGAFAFMSTCMVYAPSAQPSGIDEEHPTRCASPYAGAKLAAEHLVESYHRAYGMRTVILRPFNTYGPFQKTTGEGGVVSIFLSREMESRKLEIFGDGTQTRDLLYVEDCADFTVRAALSDAAVGNLINAGTGRDVTINELAALICRDPSRIVHVPHHHPQAEIQKLLANAGRAGQLLNWKPTVSISEGLEKTRAWIKATMKVDRNG